MNTNLSPDGISYGGQLAAKRGEKPLKDWRKRDVFTLVILLQEQNIKKLVEENTGKQFDYDKITVKNMTEWLEKCGCVGYHHHRTPKANIYRSVSYYSLERAIANSYQNLGRFNMLTWQRPTPCNKYKDKR